MANRMSFEQKFQISEWLRNKQEWLKTERPLFTELARVIEKELSFPVNPKTLTDICQTVNVAWEPRMITGKAAANSKAHALQEQIKALEGQVETLRSSLYACAAAEHKRGREMQAEIDTLRGLVHHLYYALDAAAPAGYMLPPRNGRLTTLLNK